MSRANPNDLPNNDPPSEAAHQEIFDAHNPAPYLPYASGARPRTGHRISTISGNAGNGWEPVTENATDHRDHVETGGGNVENLERGLCTPGNHDAPLEKGERKVGRRESPSYTAERKMWHKNRRVALFLRQNCTGRGYFLEALGLVMKSVAESNVP